MSKVCIINYGSGNIHSTEKAFEKMAREVGCEVLVTSQTEDLKTATHIVLPGVGAFGDCLAGIKAIPGMMEELETQVMINKKPFLGICVGMQLLAEKGYEHGEHKGFGWIKGEVKKISPGDESLKIPHMGWNDLTISTSSPESSILRGSRKNPEITLESQSDSGNDGICHPIVEGIKTGDHAYFVHSYAMQCEDKNDIVATVDYGGDITAIVAKDNIMGTQFHPEKSQETGMKLIRNFL